MVELLEGLKIQRKVNKRTAFLKEKVKISHDHELGQSETMSRPKNIGEKKDN